MQLNKEKIQIAMIRQGMTVKDLADRYGCSDQHIRQLIGSESVTLNTINKFVKALGVDVTEIIDF